MAIAEVIKYEGDNETFVWKSPKEDFNSLTQLIVHESQEAILFKNGQALDLFGPGRYTLQTQNIPKLGKVLGRTVDEKTPFHCEVYFINKTEQMSIKWGTDSKVQYIDPQYGFPLQLGASGEMALRVADSRKLLIKLVGTENALGQQKLVSFFRAFLMARVKTYIAQVIKANAINAFEIDEHLTAFSEQLQALLSPDFAEYGITLARFFVTNIVKPDGDRQYEKFKELHFRQYADIAEAKLRQQTDLIHAQTEAQKLVIDSKAQATKRQQEGYTYAQERAKIAAAKRAKILKKVILIGIAAVCVCIAFLVILVTVIFDRYKVEKLKNPAVGDIVYFGKYEQDNDASNGAEDIEWIVLTKKEDSYLVISKYALDCKPYNETYESVTWQTSSLRNWLNNDFLNKAFTEEESNQIPTVQVAADENPHHGTNPGVATSDKIFLLSINEAEQFFATDNARRCAPTAYAKAQGAYTSDYQTSLSGEATCWWWLRSPGGYQDDAAIVCDDGGVGYNGNYVRGDYVSVRPAMWISLSDEDDASLENEAAAAESEENSINDAEQLATTDADIDTSFKTNTAAISSTTPANVYDIREEARFDAAAINVGDFVLFGSYEQDANLGWGIPDPEPIEWLVLEKRESAVLVISRYVLEMGQYDEGCRSVTWENSDIRNLLNGWFLEKAFTTYEISRIPTVQVLPDINPFFDTESGNATSDKIFLLSTNEVEQYFPNKDIRKCLSTEQVNPFGGSSLYSWLLRSPGYCYSNSLASYAVRVNEDGLFETSSYGRAIGCEGIRPALWITLNA